jgi:DNA-binding CsgD family transcriptional regulator/PAS domain-containing protein
VTPERPDTGTRAQQEAVIAVRGETTPRGQHELLDLLASGSPPAFAEDSRGRIVFWNSGAEKLLGHRADEVRGRTCNRVMGEGFAFGSHGPDPKPSDGPSAAFEADVLTQSGFVRHLAVTTLRIPGFRPDLFTLVHLLQPVDEAARMAHLLGQLARLLVTVGEVGLVESAAPSQEANGNGNGRGNCHGTGPQSPSLEAAAVGAGRALTARQREVLHWMASGLQNKEIAEKIGVSLATLRNHTHNILETLGVHSKLEAVSLAFRRQWIAATPPNDTADAPRWAR